jgi:hypothetical protein
MSFRSSRMILQLAFSSAVAVWVVLLLARGLGLRSPMTAFGTVGVALGIVVVNSSIVSWSVPKRLMPVRAWEISGLIYPLLGISIFGKVLRRVPFRYLNKSVYMGGRRSDLYGIYANILQAEAAHYWASTLTMPLMIYEFTCQSWYGLGWLFLFNVLINICPSLHLRRVRGRLEPLMQRCKEREKLKIQNLHK